MSQKYVDPNALNENVIKTKQHVEAVRSALDSAKQNVIQFTTLPVPDATWNDKVVQYTGTTTQNYTKGYFYSCEVVPDTDPTEYRWARQDVMKPIDADGTTVAYDQVTGVLSAIPATNSTKGIVQHGDGTEIGSDGQVNVVDRLVVTVSLPTATSDLLNAVRLYIGASGTYELGGIYQCQETSTDVYEWVLISIADVDLSAYQKTFLGTTAEWNAKTTAQKIEFDEADLSDDLGGGMVVSNAITLGDHNPIDSDAVAQIVPSGASASNQLVTADETHDLQLFINGATYVTTTDFINKLASEINAIKPNTSRTYGGTISGEWTGKTYFIGTYTVNNTGAGIAQIKCENAQSGKDVCVFTMSGGSPAVVSWQKLVTESDFTSYGIKTIWSGSKTKGDTGMNFDASPYDLCLARVGGTWCMLITGVGSGSTARKKFTAIYAGRDNTTGRPYEQYYLLDILTDGTIATCGWFDVYSLNIQNARLAAQKALELALAGTSTWTEPTWKNLSDVESSVSVSQIIGIKFQAKS